ncbi:MAG: hypothetical protein Q7S40_01095 [Opitutaceae bacterium]|nr:hypothetical protein [Opitutaceae bacterium]
MLIALGASAAQTLMGAQFRVTRERGKVFRDVPWAAAFVATVHPSSILRMDADDRPAGIAGLVADLTVVAKLLK